MYFYLPDLVALIWTFLLCLLLGASLYLLIEFLLAAFARLAPHLQWLLQRLLPFPRKAIPLLSPEPLFLDHLPIAWSHSARVPIPLPDGTYYLLPADTKPEVITALTKLWELALPRLPLPLPQGTLNPTSPLPPTMNVASSTSA